MAAKKSVFQRLGWFVLSVFAQVFPILLLFFIFGVGAVAGYGHVVSKYDNALDLCAKKNNVYECEWIAVPKKVN